MQLELTFSGTTYNPALDANRLGKQAELVFALMQDGQYRTLGEIVSAIGVGSEAGISARLRDFRKPQFGGLVVNKRRRGEVKAGLFEYQLEAT